MSGLFSRISRLLGGKGKRLIGRDLEGNKYFELDAVNGGRTKRVVEYRIERDIADYTSGTNRLPVQWTSWLSHTRLHPPTMPELQADYQRQSSLLPKIQEIEAREQAERIRQGYLPDPNNPNPNGSATMEEIRRISKPQNGVSEAERVVAGETGTQEGKEEGGRIQNTPSLLDRRPTAASQGTLQPSADTRRTPPSQYPIPTPVSSPDIAPPRETIDPTKVSSAEELRRLSEEDTKKRIQQSTAPVPEPAEAGSKASSQPSGSGSGLKPRRRR